MVRHALRLGFTLPELAEILRVRDRGGAPCKRVLEMLGEKLDALEKRIVELQETQKFMQTLAIEWRTRIGHTPAGSKAFLLHSLETVPGSLPQSRKELKGRKQA